MAVVEIIIAELHCLSNGGHRVDCSGSYVRNGRGALSETVATVSLRTEKMLSMFWLQNKKCSETGPNRRCSGLEQYHKWFRYYLVFIMSELSNKDKMHIQKLCKPRFGAKAIKASYPDKKWSYGA